MVGDSVPLTPAVSSSSCLQRRSEQFLEFSGFLGATFTDRDVFYTVTFETAQPASLCTRGPLVCTADQASIMEPYNDLERDMGNTNMRCSVRGKDKNT